MNTLVTKKSQKKTTKKITKKAPKKTKASSVKKSQKKPSLEKSVKKAEKTPSAIEMDAIMPTKNNKNNKVVVLAVLLIALIFAAFFAITGFLPQEIESKSIVATASALTVSLNTVNGETIIQTTKTGETIYVTNDEVSYLRELFSASGYQATNDELIQEAVIRRILLDNAQELVVDTSVVDSLATNPAFQSNIAASGFTAEEFLSLYGDELKNDLIIQEFFNQKIATQIASEKAYETSHILICYVGNQMCESDRTRDEALLLAQDILDAVRETNTAEFFEEQARLLSDGPSSAQSGYLGQVTKGMMIPVFEEATFGLGENEISDIVETEFGFHIIRVSSIIDIPNQMEVMTVLTRLREQIAVNAEVTVLI